MYRIHRAVQLTAVLALLSVSLTSDAHHPDTLFDRITTEDHNYDIFFTDDNPWNCGDEGASPSGSQSDYMPFSQAMNVANAVDSTATGVPGAPAGYHEGYTDLGFRAPTFDGRDDEVYLWACRPGGPHDNSDCDNGSAENIRINLPASTYCSASEAGIRRVMGHELFHHVQYEYDRDGYVPWGKTLWEGTARMMEDHIYADLDALPNTAFMRAATKYLDWANRSFWDTSYEGALGWKHLSENYAGYPDEVFVGTDFIRELWERMGNMDKPDVPGAVQNTIAQFGSDDDLSDWFRDFAITNFVKGYDYSQFADGLKYRYLDEEDGNFTKFSKVKTIFPDTEMVPFSGAHTTQAWGATYLDFGIRSSCVAGDTLGFAARGEEDNVDFALVPIRSGGIVDDVMIRYESSETIAMAQGAGTNRIERIGVVFIGGNDREQIEWDVVCGTSGLDVHYPTSTYKEVVGPNDDPRSFTLRVTVSGPPELGGSLVRGLDPDEFSVYVGNNGFFEDDAEIIGGAYVGDEYWLNVRAPVKPDEATYDLHVNYGDLTSAVSFNAVSYQTRKLDQMLVIDVSGSMNEGDESTKLEAAQNAASLMVDITRPDLDYMGLATFNADANLDVELGEADDSKREELLNAIEGLNAGGGTSIGDGLDMSWPQFNLNGSVEGEDWVVLLSDGAENEASFWADVDNVITNAGIRVNTIALGNDADQVLLQQIANATDGDFYSVDDEDSIGTRAARGATRGAQAAVQAAAPTSMANRLADAFLSSAEAMSGHQRFWEDSAIIDGLYSQVKRIDSSGIRDARFIFNWSSADDELAVTITRPDGSLVAEGEQGASILQAETHIVVHIGDLEPGLWHMQVQAAHGEPEMLAVLAGADLRSAELDVEFGPIVEDPAAAFYGADYLRGLPMPIIARLQDPAGMVRNAQVTARIEHPDGTTIVLPLFDDGATGDTGAADGTYANRYTRTTAFSLANVPDGLGQDGTYEVIVEASGTDNRGADFTRTVKQSFQVFEIPFNPDFPSPDTDGDGMPDRYEDLHTCLNPNVNDKDGDADANGLRNGTEWGMGLNPCHVDTDRGGEVDASELDRGANPFDYRDDALPQPIDVEVVDYRYEHLPLEPGTLLPNANLIRYQAHETYTEVAFLRSLNQDGPFTEVARIPADTGLYHDLGLVNGQTYYYRVRPIGVNGEIGVASRVFSGTPNADPVPPIGSILINQGAEVTTSLNVTLRLTANSDTTEMRVADEPTFAGASWDPYLKTMPYVLSPEDGAATVYVQYRDAAGNESPTIYHDAIRVSEPGEIGYVEATVQLKGAESHGNVVAQVVGRGTSTPAFSAPSGALTLQLDPGTYDIMFSRGGYQPVIVQDVNVMLGDAASLHDVVLIPNRHPKGDARFDECTHPGGDADSEFGGGGDADDDACVINPGDDGGIGPVGLEFHLDGNSHAGYRPIANGHHKEETSHH